MLRSRYAQASKKRAMCSHFKVVLNFFYYCPGRPLVRIPRAPRVLLEEREGTKKGSSCTMGTHAFRGKCGERSCSRPTKPHSRWRPSTSAHAVVRPVLGRFATRARRGPRRKPCAGQSGALETRARFKRVHHFRIAEFVLGFFTNIAKCHRRPSASCGCGIQLRCFVRPSELHREPT